MKSNPSQRNQLMCPQDNQSEDNKSTQKDKQETIQRCPHDSENPYSQILNELIRNKDISTDCIWLLSYLLSNKDGWNINPSQIINHLKGRWGKNKVYKILNEAIEAGYAKREYIKKGNIRIGTKYFISERPKFKKCFRNPCFRDPENSDIKNTKVSPSMSVAKKTKDNVKEKPTRPEPPPPKPKPERKTLTFSKGKEMTLDLAKRFKLTPEQEQTFLWLKSKNLNTDESTLCYWAKNYSVLRLNSVITSAFKSKRANIGGYIHTLLKKNSPIHDENEDANKTFAKEYRDANHWFELDIAEKCVKIGTWWDLSLNLPPIEFARHLMAKYEERHA
jgi:hypothetical protein